MLTNNEYGNMMLAFVMDHSQECIISAASIAVVLAFVVGYKFADKCFAQVQKNDEIAV